MADSNLDLVNTFIKQLTERMNELQQESLLLKARLIVLQNSIEQEKKVNGNSNQTEEIRDTISSSDYK